MTTSAKTQGIGMTSARTRDRLVKRLRQAGINQPQILERIRVVPRHLFVDEALASRSYEDSALPIGKGQTISQPFIVALMTQTLLEKDGALSKLNKVLEVGTGCGYQTAVLGPLVNKIFSIERIGSLLNTAKQRFRDLGIGNVRFRHGDGFQGWPGQAPFDGIIVAAASPEVPENLLDQLNEGGRLIIPIGIDGEPQELIKITRTESGTNKQSICEVSFVPMLTGKEAGDS
ncbi:MAG: protein-L-isoaspartate(D-aspartate) O-methyltransferase [Pseudomonadota bacterium]|nr:protein-L-isoaspartate(D-aspartate) O-methyltransferase [Pseudomonadota bacterium]